MNKIISTITTEVKYIALKTPFITALRRVEDIEFVRVSIECSDRSIGIGEAPATFAITGEDIETILHSIKSIKDELIGLQLQDAMTALHNSSIGSSAKASLDIAILSLMGYFKLENFESIKTDITISFNPKERMLSDAKDALCRGMDILKVKLGKDINHAIEVTKEFSTKLQNARLLIDANQAWSLEDSLLYVNATDDLGLELIEQPVVASDLKGLKEIRNATKTPLLADESAFTLDEVKTIVESKSADMINIKLMKCGGVSKAVEILEYAREKGIDCMLGSMLEGPYSINAALYLAFNYRDVIKYVDLDSPLLYREASSELDFHFDGAVISF
ncbi:dipeptide epimerase [Sulfurimonas sp.]|jgi:L-Ala-D/L-Glu epimerase|uniref:dipeptide epimerase n=1 Tax=Sulfurimonas sp. TaxID=2022749 RepID=UPI0025EAF45B|nr:dipeptide epimerase [Sulfurimonas sp.]MBT5934005.1 dipeptide epimerase [Sulfurimonas sp.]